MSAELKRLSDESEIRTVLARYARAIDRMDWELLASCYHDDAIDEHGGYRGTASGFVEWLKSRLPRNHSTMHFLGNQLIEVDGEVAWTETYCLAFHRMVAEDGGPAVDRLVKVCYCDRFERRNGTWRIAHRVVAYEPGRIDPVGLEPEMSDQHVRGVRDRSDPAYRR